MTFCCVYIAITLNTSTRFSLHRHTFLGVLKLCSFVVSIGLHQKIDLLKRGLFGIYEKIWIIAILICILFVPKSLCHQNNYIQPSFYKQNVKIKKTDNEKWKKFLTMILISIILVAKVQKYSEAKQSVLDQTRNVV